MSCAATAGPDDQSRVEAALVAHLESSGTLDDSHAKQLVHAIVAYHVQRGFTPERSVVALKTVLARVQWPSDVDGPRRRQSQGEMVAWSIDEYFARRQNGSQ